MKPIQIEKSIPRSLNPRNRLAWEAKIKWGYYADLDFILSSIIREAKRELKP